jgi:hypothetical protein
MTVAAKPNELPPPPGWRHDKLSEFLDHARNNQFVTFAKKRAEYALLGEIDGAFLRVGENLINPRNPLSANLFYRSHSAYRAACGIGMSGQVPETFVLLRSCLEYAAYGLYIYKNPALGVTWLDRHRDAGTLRAMKKEFLAINVQKVVESVDARLGQVYRILYDRAIDFGGHPNVMGVAGNMAMDEQPDRIMLNHLYLHGDDDALLMALKSTAQTGATSLHIFQHIFPERFMILGVRDTLMKLRTMNL